MNAQGRRFAAIVSEGFYGQPQACSFARGANYGLLLKPDAAVLKMSGAREGSRTAQLRFRGANARAEMRGMEPLPGEANYYIGDRQNWITHVPTFGRVNVDNLYP